MPEAEQVRPEETKSMECFVSDPSREQKGRAPPPPKAAPKPPLVAPGPQRMSVEMFGGRLFSGTGLEDAKGIATALKQESAGRKHAYESPVERLQRLRREIQQLRTDVTRYAAVKAAPSLPALGYRLDQILSHPTVEPFLPANLPLLPPPSSDPGTQLVVHLPADATYQVVAKQCVTQPAALQAQVEQVEKAVGVSAAPPVPGGLIGRLGNVQRELGVLDPVSLGARLRKLKSVMADLRLLEQQKKASEGAPPSEEQQKRVAALTALHTKHASTLQQVSAPQPQREAQAACSRTLERLDVLSRQQQMVSELVTADKASLASLTANLATHMKVMSANMANLEKRLAALNS